MVDKRPSDVKEIIQTWAKVYDKARYLKSEHDLKEKEYGIPWRSAYKAVIIQKDETVEEYKARLEQVEKLIMPFLSNLLKTADKPYINWPNRKPILEAQIQKILTLTRG